MTFDEPLSSAYTGDSELHETCVWLGCVAAKGKSIETDVFNVIWNKFQSLNIHSKDGELLSYYQYGILTGDYNITDDLLRYKDGRCDGWADLFEKTLSSQGISSSQFYFIIDNFSVLDYIFNNYNILNPGNVCISLEQKSSSF